jgi:hypothetical protein
MARHKEIISKEELLKRLKACNTSDREDNHIEADELLLQYINDEDITKIWNKISSEFWYA